MNHITTPTSSTIESIGHDAESGVMEVQFKSGGIYRFKNVTAEQFKEFHNAPSHGRYFAAHFKNNPAHAMDAPGEPAPRKKKLELSPRTPLYLEGDGWKIAISKDAEAIKEGLLESAKGIVSVTSQMEALSARNQRDDINKMLVDVEKYRKIVKEPVLQKGREIDQCASSFTMDLTAEKLRIDKLLGDFARAEEEKRQAAAQEAKRLAEEADRIEAERIRKEEEAEAAAVMAERARDEAESKAEQRDASKAQKEAQRIADEAERLRIQQEATQRQSYCSTQLATAEPMKGSAKPVLDFVVRSLEELFRAAPDMVELTPRRREILNRLKAQQEMGLPVGIPGIEVVENWRVR